MPCGARICSSQVVRPLKTPSPTKESAKSRRSRRSRKRLPTPVGVALETADA
jgi:hypothetical protein